jgi:hypothetical protein
MITTAKENIGFYPTALPTPGFTGKGGQRARQRRFIFCERQTLNLVPANTGFKSLRLDAPCPRIGLRTVL